MPEVLSRYPEVVIEVLRGSGARCGPGQEQTILKACPPERFCSMPTGETCVYGLDEIGKMTQVSPKDLADRVCAAPSRTSATCGAAAGETPGTWEPGALVMVGLLAAAWLRRLTRAGTG